MDDKLATWLVTQLDRQGWSQRELARRSGTSHSTISDVIAEKRKPTWDFCASIAGAFRVPVDDVFRLAGLKSPLPAAVVEEREALTLFRRLPASMRGLVLTVLRALAQTGETMQTVRLVAEEPAVFAAEEVIDHVIEQEADELRRIWREVHRLDPDAAKRLMGIAVLQAEMVQSAAAAKPTENKGGAR